MSEALRWLPDAPQSEVVNFDVDGVQPRVDSSGAQRPRIVLADDNADMRDYLVRLLSSAYDIIAVANGEDALAEARRSRPDLILTDVMMPRLDGFQLLRELRADPALGEMPIVELSRGPARKPRLGSRDGCDDYLIKPFSARELLARVAANIELSRARSESARRLRQEAQILEQRVAEEIAERMKAEEAVRQTQRMETIGQLTGGVAHDFNNLLQVIVGNLYVLQQRVLTGKTSPEDLNLVEGAIRGAKRAAILTQRLLAFSRRAPLDPKPLDVNKMVSGMSELLRRTLGETIAIETVLAGGLWRISIDASELENALLNLAVNARDAMPAGGRLTIETANTYIDEAYAPAYQELRPGQFRHDCGQRYRHRDDQGHRRKSLRTFLHHQDTGQGTGLGLSQVYGFVKQSGSHVKIYSEPGEGTTVKVYMPRLLNESAELSTRAAARTRDRRRPHPAGRGRR